MNELIYFKKRGDNVIPKKPLIPKKVVILLSAFVLLMFGLLVYFSVFYKTEREKTLIQAESYYKAGEDRKAFDILKDIHDDTGFMSKEEKYHQLYYDLGNKLYDRYRAEARKYAENNDYEQALHFYENLIEITPSDNENLDEFIHERNRMRLLVEKQKGLDKFSKIFTPILNESNRILMDVSNRIDELYLGKITYSEFNEIMKNNITDTGKLRTDFSQSISETPSDLINVHNLISAWINDLHTLIIKASNTDNDEELQNLIDMHNNINRSVSDSIQQIEDYAQANGLKFEFIEE